MNKRIVLVTFLLLAAIIGGYVFHNTSQSGKRTKEGRYTGKDAIPSNWPTTQVNPTENWKTYANTEYKYAVKYPIDWQIGVSGGADPATFPAPYIESPCNYDGGQTCSQLLIEVGKTDGKLEPSFIIDASYDKILSKKSSKLDTEQAQEIVYLAGNQGVGGNKLYYVLVANHNGTKYTVRYEESKKNREYKTPADWEHKKITDQILSTFRFTN